jgi:hypothetical protein
MQAWKRQSLHVDLDVVAPIKRRRRAAIDVEKLTGRGQVAKQPNRKRGNGSAHGKLKIKNEEL